MGFQSLVESVISCQSAANGWSTKGVISELMRTF